MAVESPLTIDGLTLTRVLYVDVPVPPEITGLTRAQVEAVPWAEPQWATADGSVLASASAWIVEAPGRTIVLDPLQAADDVLHDPDGEQAHQDGFAAALAAAGFDRERVDTVVISHIETIGMVAERTDGTWRPFFPNARIAMSQAAHAQFVRAPGDHFSAEVWRTFLDDGRVDIFEDDAELAPGMRAEVSGAHNPGHTVFHFGDGPDATWLGHLAISPIHLATGECPQQHPEPARAWEVLHGYADDGRILLGPLWPSPGCGRWDGHQVIALRS